MILRSSPSSLRELPLKPQCFPVYAADGPAPAEGRDEDMRGRERAQVMCQPHTGPFMSATQFILPHPCESRAASPFGR